MLRFPKPSLADIRGEIEKFIRMHPPAQSPRKP
jgi:hypothetical protein